MSEQRHKWERKIHKYHRELECIKCGCIKDTRVIGLTIYLMGGEKFYHAPPCVAKQEEKGGNE